MANDEPVVAIHQLQFTWPGSDKPVLKIDELTINAGQHLFIQGESGCGKTSLLNLLSGITEPDNGELKVLGKSIAQLSTHQRDLFRADHLGVIFQQFNLLPFLSVMDNVTLPFYFSRRRRSRVSNIQESAEALLTKLEINRELHDQNVLDLSVGQQQRVACARALVGNPELIIADEPTSALDTKNKNYFLRLLFDVATEHNSTLIFVSHDDQLADRFDHIVDLAKVNQSYMSVES